MYKDQIGTRMKTYYETVPKTRLMRRVPVAIRIDGRSFHTWTRGFQKPFDSILMTSMQETMKYLCENIQGCVFGFTQSDEITLILIDYQKLTSSAWFDYEIQKMCSIAASMATLAFNKFFIKNVNCFKTTHEKDNTVNMYCITLANAIERGAMFDARCFNIPKEEVANLIYWRQLDAMRNSVQMVGQANFSHRELQNKSCKDIKNMLLSQKGIDWNSLPEDRQRGAACIKLPPKEEVIDIPTATGKPFRMVTYLSSQFSSWIIDKHMPILKENWDYINRYIYVGE